MSSSLYDLSVLEEMVYGDTVFMKELIDTFIEYAPIDSKELCDFAQEKNWDETSKKAHKLKSSIRTIGVISLTDLILSIENDAKNQQNLDTIHLDIDRFATTLEEVIVNLKKESFKN